MPEDSLHSDAAPQPPPEAADASYPSLGELAQLLPQYEMHEVIGIGGMGAVYKARQAALDRWVAIKLLPASTAQNEEDARRFIKEARAMARLVHPHIVAVFDFGQTYAGHLYLVMEYVEGSDLHRRTRNNEVTPQRAREVIAQLCDALQFAHDHGVAHRDIKPANILITNQWKVKVADFGLARELAAQPNLDEPEYGTPDYTAPERLVVGAVVDHRADIFALGVVIHEMLTGKTPMAAGSEAGKGLPEGFAGVISKCLMHDPARRYQRAAEVKLALLSAAAETQRQEGVATGRTTRTMPRQTALEAADKEDIEVPPKRSIVGPIVWGLASVLLLMLFGGLILRNRTQQWERTNVASPANTVAGAGDLAVFAPRPEVKPPAPAPASEPAVPAPPKVEPSAPKPPAMVASNSTPAPAPVPPPATLTTAPVNRGPYKVPEGPPGEVARFKGHTDNVGDVKILSDQQRAVSVSADGTLRVWMIETQQETLKLDPGIGPLASVAIAQDDRRAIVSSLNADMVAFVDLETADVLAVTSVPQGRVGRSVFFPGDEEVLLSAFDSDPSLYRWHPEAGTEMEPVEGWPYSAYEMEILPDASGVVIAGGKSMGALGQQPISGRLNFSGAEHIVFEKDAAFRRLCMGADRRRAGLLDMKEIRVVDWPSLERIHTIPFEFSPGASVHPMEVVLMNGGDRLLTKWTDNSLRIIESATRKELYRAEGKEVLSRLVLSRDEQWLLMTAREKTQGQTTGGPSDIMLWRLPTGHWLVAEDELIQQARAQLADLARIDAELARLKAELEDNVAVPDPQVAAAEVQSLNLLYVGALRRAAQGLAPREQQPFLNEIEQVTGNAPLPDENSDPFLPTGARKLRTIYRQQLAALKEKQAQALAEVSKVINFRLAPLKEQRLNQGDRVAAMRVELVSKALLNPTGKGGGAGAAAVQRPSRTGTVVAIPRTSVNGGAPSNRLGAGSVPGDLGSVVALTGGADHVLALRPDGSVVAWGLWEDSAVTVPDDVKDIVRLNSNSGAALALRADGKVVAWGPKQGQVIWSPPSGAAPVDVCAGRSGGGYVLCEDGQIYPTSEAVSSSALMIGPVAKLFYDTNVGFYAILRDGTHERFGPVPASLAAVPAHLRDLAWLSFGQRYGVAMQRDGTLTGWGQLAPDQRFRIRRFTGSVAIPHDYADRVFPVHRSDHSWELVPNPSVPAYMAEDRPALIEGRLRGSIDAVFAAHYVIALKP